MATGTVKPIFLEEEMKSSYLDYAMSVIVARALPDIRDGLKPVQRRILYSMDGLNLKPGSAYKKSARIVGEVMGKYHPHGDAPVYEAMVRLAQDFSMRYTLVDGQGNFGSIDDDPPAAMRYTEARLAKIAEEMLTDLEKDTVDFTSNFDDSLKEPKVLPARIPNLLINGSAGIAVGMATNIPPHNLVEVCDAISYLIDNPEASVEDLMRFVVAPDFPTGGIIQGREGIRNAFIAGKGKLVVRAKVEEVSLKTGRNQIVITELPYQTNKAALVARIAQLTREKKIDGISEVRDESDREGIRVVIDLRKEAQTAKILNNLYKNTMLETAFFVNMVALVDGQPKTVNLKDALSHFITFRRTVITRRSQFELNKAKERAHILEGFRIVLDKIDEVIDTIRKSDTAEQARNNLMNGFGLSQIQAQAVLDMQLRRLASLERKKILDEYAEILKTISHLEELLGSQRNILNLILQEVKEVKTRHGDKRRTQISEEEVQAYRDEDLIPHESMVVTISSVGYIKRIPLSTYKLQRRSTRGVQGTVVAKDKETDTARYLFSIADTHDDLLLFTNRGRVYRIKCYEIPLEHSRTVKGTALVNLVTLDNKETVNSLMAVNAYDPNHYLVMVTSGGEVKRTQLLKFARIRTSGLTAINPRGKGEMVSAIMVEDKDDIIIVSRSGKAVRFNSGILRIASRTSGGVRGLKVEGNDEVVAMDKVSPELYLLTVTENGYGKLTKADGYPVHGRGGKGVISQVVNNKTGELVSARLVSIDQELVMMSAQGVINRIPINGIRVVSRNTQGVRLMKLDRKDKVVSIDCADQDAIEKAVEKGAKEPQKEGKPPLSSVPARETKESLVYKPDKETGIQAKPPSQKDLPDKYQGKTLPLFDE